MGILRFNRLINRQHTKRLSGLVLVFMIFLLFFNFKYLKAFYNDIGNNSKELTLMVKNLDENTIKAKQDEMKVALADKKKEIEGKIEKQNAKEIKINDYILNNTNKEDDLVYSSEQISILVDDSLF
jgi:Sec-independent protein translocase protein TatA